MRAALSVLDLLCHFRFLLGAVQAVGAMADEQNDVAMEGNGDGEQEGWNMGRVSRADYGRAIQIEENHYKGNTVRMEHQILQLRLNKQREAFKERGRMLREERGRSAERANQSRDARKQAASGTADGVRKDRDRFRVIRETNDQKHKAKGRNVLTQQADLQKKLRNDAESLQSERCTSASDLKRRSKEREAAITDRRFLERCRLADHVKQCAGRDVTRESKMAFINGRWDNADALRDQMESLRALRRRQEHEYLATALAKREELRAVSKEAQQQQEAEMRRQGENLRRQEKEMNDRIEAAKEHERNRKKALHEAMNEGKLVPPKELEHEMEVNKDTLGAAFNFFFGFRKRASGMTSSVTL